MTEHFQKEIEELREKINKIDAEIVRVLNERAKLVLSIKDVKSKASIPLYDPRREEEIFEHVSRSNQGPLYDDALREVYEKILHAMKDLEKR